MVLALESINERITVIILELGILPCRALTEFK